MTSEGSEEPKATEDPSKKTSGEAASRESRSDSDTSSGERSEDEAKRSPRKRERGADATRERSDDIPLQIAGHDERDPPGDREEILAFDEPSGSDGEADDPRTERASDEEDDEGVEPVELLVQLAKEGDIDPWDIDVVRVTDKFLEALDETDLRTSGRALFYASVLIRMKSDELFAPDEPEEEELPPWEAPFADDGAMAAETTAEGGFDPVDQLEAEMERRLDRKHARGKPETLDELVRELRSAERGSRWKESRSYDTSGSPRGFDRGMQELHYHAADEDRIEDEPTADDVTHTTHEEDIEDVIDDVESSLQTQYENGREEVLYAEIEDAGGSRVLTYLALLFLAHRGRVHLEQDELFGDLWIQRATVEAEPEEAVAD